MSKQVKRLILSLVVIGTAGVAASFCVSLRAGLISAIATGCLCAVFCIFTRRRYRAIAQLSDYLRRVANGQFELALRDNDEGELSILKNNIYTLSSMLTEQAGQLSREKRSLQSAAADISHQLKTPLTSLLMMAELLEDETLPPEKRREFLQNLKIGLSRMEWMVLSLLKMARLDSGTAEFKKGPVFADKLLAAALEPLTIMLELRGQRAILPEDAPPCLICDSEWTREALTNILKNASEHSPDDGAIAVHWGENPLCRWISVTDSGTGIASKDLPHIFKRFYSQNKRGGVGIGLALSLAVMRGQSGDIEVVSPTGQGASFTLKFFK
ncbi:MAG: HAMP domain-containing histidine kinase [Clostridiales bacterium]|jgi:signal transduction histidine kinase|nr:HAMP domain-containing histidine kinase [Clostridiales bacterium]